MKSRILSGLFVAGGLAIGMLSGQLAVDVVHAQTTGTPVRFLNLLNNTPIDATVGGACSAGPTGPAGPAGPLGPVGPPGATGATGQQGIQGLTGTAGQTGAQGLQGIQGLKGDAGITGAQGLQGIPGKDGAQGLPGLNGPIGPEGKTGAQGLQGLQGLKGDTGQTGPAGQNGTPGATGSTGAQGPQGLQGPIGPSGSGILLFDQAQSGNVQLTSANAPVLVIQAPTTGRLYLGTVTLVAQIGNNKTTTLKFIAGSGTNCSVGMRELAMPFPSSVTSSASYGLRVLNSGESLCVSSPTQNMTVSYSSTYTFVQ